MLQVFAGSAAYPRDMPRPVLTIGNFDGLHLGHRHLISALVAKAKAKDVPAAVYTFDPPPRVVLSPDEHPPRIQSWPDKVRILGELGVDHVIVERFTRAFAQHPASWFLDEVLGRRIQPMGMVVGYDTRFGRGRAGDVSALKAAFPEIEVSQIHALKIDGQVVSSSKIRTLVTAGEVAQASVLLGCPHRVRGTVMHGDGRGHTLGFPTANLLTEAMLTPARGVYAVRAQVEDGPWHHAVANLGTRPTFDGQSFLIEVHLLDHTEDLYGCGLNIEFVARLRGETTFEGPNDLIQQIQRDIAQARAVLSP